MKRSHFYYDFPEAVILREKVIKKLIGKTWKPYNTEITDIAIMPNDNLTFRLEVIYTNGARQSFYEFMTVNKIKWSFFDEE